MPDLQIICNALPERDLPVTMTVGRSPGRTTVVLPAATIQTGGGMFCTEQELVKQLLGLTLTFVPID